MLSLPLYALESNLPQEQSEAIQNLEIEKVGVGKLDAGLAVKAHASDLVAVHRSIDALVSALVDQIEDRRGKLSMVEALCVAAPSKFLFELKDKAEKDLALHPPAARKEEPTSHTQHLKQLQAAVNQLQCESKEKNQALADLDTQNRFKTKQFSEFLRDKANAEMDMEEKQRAIQKATLGRVGEEMQSKIADMNAEVEAKMQKLAKENKQFARKADAAARTMQQGQELRERKDAEFSDDVHGLMIQLRALGATQAACQDTCTTISLELDSMREPLVTEIRNMKEGNKTLLVELDRHGSAFRSVLGEFDLHRTEWFKKEGRNLMGGMGGHQMGGSSSHPALRRSQNPNMHNSSPIRSQPRVRSLQPLTQQPQRRARGPLG
jgi:hypothetical protein